MATAKAELFRVRLGAKVKDIVTGFSGVVTARTEWLSGCIRYLVSPQKLDKDDKPVEGQWIDEQQLLVLSGGLKLVQQPTGGPKPSPSRQGNPQRGMAGG